jgi:integrase
MSVTVRPYRSGGWEVDILWRSQDGRRRRERKRLTGNRSAAIRWGEARERDLLVNGITKPKQEVPTLNEFAPRFIEQHAEAERQKPSGIAAKKTILKHHLQPFIGRSRLDAITGEDIQRIKYRLRHRAPKTVNNVLAVLKMLLRKAVEWQVIDQLPCTIRWIPAPKPTMTFYDFEQFERVVDVTEGDPLARAIVLLGGEAGLRCGEMMALEWSDVDFKLRQICVSRSEWKGHVTAPKSNRHRFVPMTVRLAEALPAARHLRNTRVLCQADGTSLTQKEVQVVMKRVARHAHVRPGVHILRHTFCSHLAMKGVPARAIQELAGHRDLATTQRYLHLSPAAIADAIRVLDQPRVVFGRGDIVETGDRQQLSTSC